MSDLKCKLSEEEYDVKDDITLDRVKTLPSQSPSLLLGSSEVLLFLRQEVRAKVRWGF